MEGQAVGLGGGGALRALGTGKDRGIIEGTGRNAGPTWKDGKEIVDQVPRGRGGVDTG